MGTGFKANFDLGAIEVQQMRDLEKGLRLAQREQERRWRGRWAETVTDCGGCAGCAAGGRGYVGVSSYCQILRGEASQAGQAAPGRRAVQLLHLLRQLLLQPPLFLILLRVGKLHHHGGGAALCGQIERERRKVEKEEG